MTDMIATRDDRAEYGATANKKRQLKECLELIDKLQAKRQKLTNLIDGLQIHGMALWVVCEADRIEAERAGKVK